MILSADTVIINGDFWDSYFVSFEEFLNSEWQKLFSLLKQKHAVYIYGNHDPQAKISKGYLQFADKAAAFFEFKSGGRTFYVEHGDRLSKPLQDRLSWLKLPLFIKKVHNFSEYLSAKMLKNRTPANYFKARSLFARARKGKEKEVALVLAHSHLPVKDDKNNNYGTGYIGYGYGSYLLVTEDKVSRVESDY